MFCYECGHPIADTARFCPKCGARQLSAEDTDEFSGLIHKAKLGDQDAFAKLYEGSYSKVYYTVRSMIKDEDTVLDIIQDSYIKAFNNLDRFDEQHYFLPWMKQIAANTARDWLKRKKPMLFSEISSEGNEEYNLAEQIADENPSNMPEVVIDQEETVRLIREILEEVPEDQRAVIGMYYYQEMSVKEISAALGISDSAVKSRLLYGRRKIETRVLDLEKKGTKLYSLTPFPFFLLLMRLLRQDGRTVQPDAGIIQNVICAGQGSFLSANVNPSATSYNSAGNFNNKGNYYGDSPEYYEAGQNFSRGYDGYGYDSVMYGASNAGRTAGRTAAGKVAAGGLGIGKTVAIAAAAIVVAGGTVFGVSQVINHDDRTHERSYHGDDDDEEVLVSASEEEEIVVADSAESVIAASAADTDEGDNTEKEVEPVIDYAELARQEYTSIISNAASYDFKAYDDEYELGEYRYAIVRIEDTDEIPALLIAAEMGYAHATNIRVFQYDTTSETVLMPDEKLRERNFLIGKMSNGHGLAQLDRAGAEDIVINRIVLSGNSLISAGEYSFKLTEQMDLAYQSDEIEWHDLTDLSAVETLEAIDSVVIQESVDAQSQQVNVEEDLPTSVSAAEEELLPTDGNRLVLVGTVKEYSYDEIVKRQGCPDPNAGPYTNYNAVYRVIDLDTPQRMELRSGDANGYHTSEAWCICIRNVSGIDAYMNQRICFSIDPSNTYWPGGTDMPLGQPDALDVHVLKTY